MFQVKKEKLFLILCALILSLVAGCVTNEKTYKKGNLTLSYRNKTTSVSELDRLDLAHPKIISQSKLATHLIRLAYTHNAILSKGTRVFTAEEVSKLSKVLPKALKKATPNKIIYFELDSDDGTTAVELFASGNQLNWKFDTIHGIRYSKNMLRGWGSTWRLIPQKGQALYSSQKILGSKTWDNWVISMLNLPEN